jgi:hypothetical protein
VISPNTLHRAACEEIVAPHKVVPEKEKKGRKRSKPTNKSASQPTRAILQDGPAVRPRKLLHEAGTPMMNDQLLAVANAYMRSLHHSCLYIEERRIKDRDESYLVFQAKVPDVPGFVQDYPADIFYVRHTDIFDMLNGIRLHDTLVRLYSLNTAAAIIKDATPGNAIVDPYYMRDAVLHSEENIQKAINYLKGFFQVFADKSCILMPYHPVSENGRQHCVLIYVDLKDCRTTYFDSSSKQTRKNYDTIRRVLDEALNGYVAAGGTVERPVKKFGIHVFSHKFEFWCAKQPNDSMKDAFYAIHNMKATILDHHKTTLPKDYLHTWADRRKQSDQDRAIRQDFFDIQEEISEIICVQIIRARGMFYSGVVPRNSAIDERLLMQGDDRNFMVLAKGARAGFINVPKPTNMPKKS